MHTITGILPLLLFFLFCTQNCFSADIPKGSPLSSSEWKQCEMYIKRKRHTLFSNDVAYISKKSDLPCSLTLDAGTGSVYINLSGRKGAEIGAGCNKVVTKSILYNSNPKIVARCVGDASLFQEARVLSHLKEVRGIAQLYSLIKHTNVKAELMMEYFNSGSLKEVVSGSLQIHERESISIAFDLITGLKAVHERGFIHRDLHQGNIIFDRRNGKLRAAIIDFGLAMEMDQEPTAIISVSPTGCPAEVLLNPYPKIDRRKSESYSLGVLLYVLLFKNTPSWAKIINQLTLDQQSHSKKISMHTQIHELYKKSVKEQLPHASGIRKEMVQLVFKMIHPNPIDRISLDQAQNEIALIARKQQIFL